MPKSSDDVQAGAACHVTTVGRARAALRSIGHAFAGDDRRRATEAWDLAAGLLIVVAVIVATW